MVRRQTQNMRTANRGRGAWRCGPDPFGEAHLAATVETGNALQGKGDGILGPWRTGKRPRLDERTEVEHSERWRTVEEFRRAGRPSRVKKETPTPKTECLRQARRTRRSRGGMRRAVRMEGRGVKRAPDRPHDPAPGVTGNSPGGGRREGWGGMQASRAWPFGSADGTGQKDPPQKQGIQEPPS